jgi:hypothetical protein
VVASGDADRQGVPDAGSAERARGAFRNHDRDAGAQCSRNAAIPPTGRTRDGSKYRS